jgi:AraC-like DNA-binding protein
MSERSDYPDFYIRDQAGREALVKPHRHEYFQIQINLEGDTRQQIGAGTRPFRRGYVSFILPYRVHCVPHPENARFFIINFSQRFLFPALDVDPLDLEEVPLLQTPELGPFLFQPYMDFAFSEDDFCRIEELIAKMRTEHNDRRLGSLELLRAYLLQLLGLTCRTFEGELLDLAGRHAQRSGQRDALRRVTRYIREHLAEELSLADAAEAAFLSPNYLSHLIRKETGKTFTDLVTERRMERAQELLATTALPVTAVAHAAGFADVAYFTRRFRQWNGQSPSAYRNGAGGGVSTTATTTA